MPDVEFGKLEDLPLCHAWKHEARSFTPWLAGEKRSSSYDNSENWDAIIDWQEERRQAYSKTLIAILKHC